MPTIINQAYGKVVIRTTANVNSNVSSFAVSSDVANDAPYLTGLEIKKVWYNGRWDILRGSNTILRVSGNGLFDVDDISLSEDATANVIIRTPGAPVGDETIIVEMKKRTTQVHIK